MDTTQPIDMTYPQFRKARYAALRAKYTRAEASRRDLLLCMPESKTWPEYLEACKQAATKGPLRRRLLDSLVTYIPLGESATQQQRERAVLHIFRGVYEPGAKGWLPPSVRLAEKTRRKERSKS